MNTFSFRQAIFIVVAFLSISFQINANTPEATAAFRYVKGHVQVLDQQGNQGEAQVQDVLGVGDTVVVGEGSLAIIELEDKSIVKVSPNSTLVFEELVSMTATDHEESEQYSGWSTLLLKTGSIFSEVAQKFSDAPILQVKNSKDVALGVRGTEFEATVDQATGDFLASVKSGEVEVIDSNSDDSEIIPAGQGMVVENGQTISRPHAFKWAQRVANQTALDERVENFQQWRQEVRSEFGPMKAQLMNRQKRPVRDRVQQWKQNKGQRRAPVERYQNMLERRKKMGEKLGIPHVTQGPLQWRQKRKEGMKMRHENRVERREDRQDNRQDRRDKRQENREDRRKSRQDNRQDRRDQRQDNRQERRDQFRPGGGQPGQRFKR